MRLSRFLQIGIVACLFLQPLLLCTSAIAERFVPYATSSLAAGGHPTNSAGSVTNQVAGSAVISGDVYVAVSGNDGAGGGSWATAKATIQAAVEAAPAGGRVWVSNGVYQAGGRVAEGAQLTNRVAVDKAVAVRSVNGPEVTWIVGGLPAAGSGLNGEGAVRCVYLAEGAVLSGFTLTNGHTLTDWIGRNPNNTGGGVYCASTNAVVSNCVVAGCSAYYGGGGAAGGSLYDCALQNNDCSGDSGGGAIDSTLYNCRLLGNRAWTGGGAYNSRLYNCLVVTNSAYYFGGGAYYGELYNCTVVGNLATSESSDAIGGAYGATIVNSIVYFNTAPGNPSANFSSYATLSNSCTFPLPGNGGGNMTNDPGILSLDNPRLLAGSPCVDRGLALGWLGGARDLDGEARLNGPVDLGADELWLDGLTGPITVSIQAALTNVVPGFALRLEARLAGKVQGYQWDFGDGTTQAGALSVAHAFGGPGVYPVTLTASNLEGRVTATVAVTVISGDVYVAVSGNDGAGGGSWATAKATIQAAVEAAPAGGRVWVSNGVYQAGGRAAGGALLTNRVAVDKAVAVRSVNGPDVTWIVGGLPAAGSGLNGEGAVRCVYLAEGAVLSGFTLTNGHTLTSWDLAEPNLRGGGAYCASTNAVVSNCVVAGCSAYNGGGGAAGGSLYDCALRNNDCFGSSGGGVINSTLYNCRLLGNRAWTGGGAYNSRLYNCLVVTNSAAYYGGGAYSGELYNCTVVGNAATSESSDAIGGAYGATIVNSIVYFNTAPGNPSANFNSYATLSNSCTIPLPGNGGGNMTNDPGILSLDNPRLLAGSPCVDRGLALGWLGGARDLDGEARLNGPVDLGADELWLDGLTGPITVSIQAALTNVVPGFALRLEARLAGKVQGYQWDFGDGTTQAGALSVAHAFGGPGVYPVTLTASNLEARVTATVAVTVISGDVYVAVSGNDGAGGGSWATAKATIQAAVEAAPAGGRVWVSNGVYQAGGRAAGGALLTNRVAVDKAVAVRSVNGPEVTWIAGGLPAGSDLNGEGAVRCVYLAEGAVLSGFTLTNGHTLANYSLSEPNKRGGGVYCASTNAVVSNCVVAGCSAYSGGGGAAGGSLYDCALLNNDCWSDSGGGVINSTLFNCRFLGNRAWTGGGAYYSRLYNCLVVTNSAYYFGGGAYSGELYNCTVVGNLATSDSSGAIGGVSDARIVNSIVYFNTAPGNPSANYSSATFSNSCTFPLPSNGGGNFTNNPNFLSPSLLWLAAGSPCIDRGLRAAWMDVALDLAGNPRIVGTNVDIGAFEYVEQSGSPRFALQPQDQLLLERKSATFSGLAVGGAPLSYQWRKNSGNLPGQTNLDLTISPLGGADTGDYQLVAVNSFGSATSRVARLTVVTFAEILDNPGMTWTTFGYAPWDMDAGNFFMGPYAAVSQVPGAGQSNVLQTTITGPGDLSFWWRITTESYSDELVFQIDGVKQTSIYYNQPWIQGSYRIAAGVHTLVWKYVTGSYGGSGEGRGWLDQVIFERLNMPSISVEPQSQTIVAGATATFAVSASGSAPLAYQWRKNGGNLTGANNTNYSIPNAQPSFAGNYTVVITNALGSVTSQVAVLTVLVPPQITAQPQSRTNIAGTTASFSVVASGTAPLAYQWRKDGASLVGQTGGSVTIAGVQSGDAGNYSVVITNSAGSVTSQVAALTVLVPPQVVTQPASLTNLAGTTATFSVSAAGTLPLAYQWRKDGVSLVGAASANYSIASAQLSHSGNYTVVITNSAGSVTSQVAVLTVMAPPQFVVQPRDRIAFEGGGTSFEIQATGSSPHTVQWWLNGALIPGDTGSLELTNLTASQAGTYIVVLSNTVGSVTSAPALLTILKPAGPRFRIASLATAGATVVNHQAQTSTGRGAIAVSATDVLCTGASGSARFYKVDLSWGTGIGATRDGLFGDLSTEAVYDLRFDTNTTRVTALLEVNGSSGALTGHYIPLSDPVWLTNNVSGIFAGYGRVLLYNGDRVYDVQLPSGIVTDCGPLALPAHQTAGRWAFWGVAEYFDNSLYPRLCAGSANHCAHSRFRWPHLDPRGVQQFGANGQLYGFPRSQSLVFRAQWFQPVRRFFLLRYAGLRERDPSSFRPIREGPTLSRRPPPTPRATCIL